MNDPFFRNSNLPDFSFLLKAFRSLLTETAAENKYWKGFVEQLELNLPLFQDLIRNSQETEFPQLLEKIFSRVEPAIQSESNFYINREELFSPQLLAYLATFRMSSRDSLKNLRTHYPQAKGWLDLSQEDESRKYFRRFLILSTFFCTAYNINLAIDKGGTIIVQSSKHLNTTLKLETKTYYLFYNRSHIGGRGIGIGQLTINTAMRAKLEYFYSPRKLSDSDITPAEEPFTVKTTGRVKKYGSRSILVVKDLIDTELDEEAKKKGQGVESFYVLKHFDKSDESFLLGIACSWNRDTNFPFATAIILADKEFYDKQYPEDSAFSFNRIRGDRNLSIPPSFAYYLLDRSISLESIIQDRYDDVKGNWRPFSQLADIPLFNDQSKFLDRLAGRYKGLTVVRSEDGDRLVISELSIEPTGLVSLRVNNENDEPVDFRNNDKGVIKRIKVNRKDGTGKIFINLKYNFAKHYSSLNYYLYFDHFFERGNYNQTEPFFLKGGFAGESLISNRAIASSIIFQKVEGDQEITITQRNLNELTTKAFSDLYASNKALFDFYLSNETDNYTNRRGIRLLKRKKEWAEMEQKNISTQDAYDVFISIPMTANNSEEEYDRNCKIAADFIDELIVRCDLKREKIFCACLHQEGFFSYQQYCEHYKTPGIIYSVMNLNLHKSSTVIYIHPKPLLSSGSGKISSSIIELGYALGLRCRIAVVYDEEEKDNLPRNLMELTRSSQFTFITTHPKAFVEMFNYFSNERRMRSLVVH